MLKGTWSRSDSGERVAVGGADRTVTVWNVESGQIQYKLPGHKGTVTCVDFHPKEPISAPFSFWILKCTEPVRSTNGKQRYDAAARRTRGDCTYQVGYSTALLSDLSRTLYRTLCIMYSLPSLSCREYLWRRLTAGAVPVRQFQFKRTLNMTATSSSQSPSPPDAVPSPLPEYLQRFEQQLPPKREYKIPKLHWKVEDLETKGAERVFLHCISPVKLLSGCIIAIFDLLYTAESCPTQYVRRLCPYLARCLWSIVWD